MGFNIITIKADLSISEYCQWFWYLNVSQWICCNQKLGTVHWTDDDNKAHTGFSITIIIARLSISEYSNMCHNGYGATRRLVKCTQLVMNYGNKRYWSSLVIIKPLCQWVMTLVHKNLALIVRNNNPRSYSQWPCSYAFKVERQTTWPPKKPFTGPTEMSGHWL